MNATTAMAGAMTWPERIENYRKQIGVPYLAYEGNWTPRPGRAEQPAVINPRGCRR
jgi:hypothetical protein